MQIIEEKWFGEIALPRYFFKSFLIRKYICPLNNVEVRDLTPHTVENLCISFDSTKTYQ